MSLSSDEQGQLGPVLPLLRLLPGLFWDSVRVSAYCNTTPQHVHPTSQYVHGVDRGTVRFYATL